MPDSYSGHLFVYNNSQTLPEFFDKQLKNSDLQLFDTGNLYQLLQYTKELLPKLLIITQETVTGSLKDTLDRIHAQNLRFLPTIILIKNGRQKFLTDARIAHYVSLPEDYKKFRDIMESYDFGNKKHQILLISSYNQNADKLHLSLLAHNIRYFEVHTIDAANFYLQKNTPQIICIQAEQPFLQASRQLQHNRIFYVDIGQDITEISHFLN